MDTCALQVILLLILLFKDMKVRIPPKGERISSLHPFDTCSAWSYLFHQSALLFMSRCDSSLQGLYNVFSPSRFTLELKYLLLQSLNGLLSILNLHRRVGKVVMTSQGTLFSYITSMIFQIEIYQSDWSCNIFIRIN